MEKKCPICGKPVRGNRTYCGNSCSAKARWRDPGYYKRRSESAKATFAKFREENPGFSGITHLAKTNPEKYKEFCDGAKVRFDEYYSTHKRVNGWGLWAQYHPDEAHKVNSERAYKTATTHNNFTVWGNKYPELRSKISRENVVNLATYRSSMQELSIFNKISSIFPELTVLSNEPILGYKPDILIKELGLIIEVDGSLWHDKKIQKDLNRDRRLFSAGFKVRRLDADYASRLSNFELFWMVILECSIDVPYYDRIPIQELGLWKWDIYQTGPRKLLTYEVKNAE